MLKVQYYLDILKPHLPNSDMVARALMEVEGIDKVIVKVDELDQKTASLHIKIEGWDIDIDTISSKLEEFNCALHSVDEVVIERIEE